MDEMTVVVTGGSRGIGAATVRELVGAGADVVTCARDAEALAALGADLDGPGTLRTQRADVRDEYDVERLVETASREGDGVDAVVANAGVYHGDPGQTPVTEESYATVDDHLRVNARGVFVTFREALPHLTDDARMVALSGRIARQPRSGFGSYAVSKAAAEAVARQFAVDCEVPVGVVDPGTVATDLTGGQGSDPAHAADLVAWALTEADDDTVDGNVLDRGTMRGR
ncbi:short-chain dehydrogenase [Halobacteriales archaeon QH_10_67_22]|nr:MAG: short-chain dehydrogenase [Halobacteriales archaeon QH_10_67_22]